MIEGTWNKSARAGARRMKAHLVVIIVTALAAVTCGATFLLALFRQFGLVEVAASLAAGAEVFFLSSSIGDLLEDREEPNRTRFLAALGLTVAIVMYFLIMRFKESAGG
jgi:hypothetical protein